MCNSQDIQVILSLFNVKTDAQQESTVYYAYSPLLKVVLNQQMSLNFMLLAKVFQHDLTSLYELLFLILVEVFLLAGMCLCSVT